MEDDVNNLGLNLKMELFLEESTPDGVPIERINFRRKICRLHDLLVQLSEQPTFPDVENPKVLHQLDNKKGSFQKFKTFLADISNSNVLRYVAYFFQNNPALETFQERALITFSHYACMYGRKKGTHLPSCLKQREENETIGLVKNGHQLDELIVETNSKKSFCAQFENTSFCCPEKLSEKLSPDFEVKDLESEDKQFLDIEKFSGKDSTFAISRADVQKNSETEICEKFISPEFEHNETENQIPQAQNNEGIRNDDGEVLSGATTISATESEKESFKLPDFSMAFPRPVADLNSESYNQINKDKLETMDSKEETNSVKELISPEEFCEISGIDPSLLNYKLPTTIRMISNKLDWSQLYSDELDFDYGNLLRHLLDTQHPIPCHFTAQGKRKLSKNSSLLGSIRGYCGSNRYYSTDNKTCQVKFKVHVKQSDTNPDQAIVEVELKGEFKLFQNISSGGYAKGTKRKDLKKELKHITAYEHHVQGYSTISDLKLLHKNLPTRSMAVLRKIRSEINFEKGYRNQDIVIGIRQIQQKLKQNPRFECLRFPDLSGYVQMNVDSPFPLTLMYSPSQVRFASKCDTIYLDATGNIVPSEIVDPKNPKKRQLLLHSAVAKMSTRKNIPAVPVMEAISAKGDVPTITNLLLHFVADVRKFVKDWYAKIVVVDMCLAYLHSTILAFNQESMESYINRCFDRLHNEGAENPCKKTIVFACSNHLMHAVSRYLRKKSVKKDSVEIAMYAFSQLIEAQDLATIKILFKNIITLFGYRNLTKKREENLVKFFKGQKEESFNLDDNLDSSFNYDEDDPQTIMPNIDPKLQREKSKFFALFRKNKLERLKANNIVHRPNSHFSQVILNTVERWITYLPIFSKIGFFGVRKIPKKTITTAPCEEYFQDMKHTFHEGKEFRPNMIEKHSEVCVNLVDRALVNASSYSRKRKNNNSENPIKPKKSRPEVLGSTKIAKQSLEFATSKWSKRKKQVGKSYKEKINLAKTFLSNKNKQLESESKDEKQKENETKVFKVFPDYFTQKNQKREDKSPQDVIQIHDQESNDLSDLNEKIWVKETEQLRLFVTGKFGLNGFENEILTLCYGRFISASVADVAADKLIQQFRTEEIEKRRICYVDSALVTQIQACQLRSSPSFLPDEESFDIDNGKIYCIIFANNHALLTESNFANGEISFYDSLPGCIGVILKTKIFDSIKSMLQTKYAVVDWKQITKESTIQTGNNCVIFSLLNLRSLLLRKTPSSYVSATEGNPFRKELTTLLLETTNVGNKLLRKFQTVEQIWDCLDKREKHRAKVEKAFKMRNEINQLEIENNVGQNGLKLNTELQKIIASIENGFPGPGLITNSQINSWD